nr:immunoglobulin heavy chain junction region [Macaca mulatta]
CARSPVSRKGNNYGYYGLDSW